MKSITLTKDAFADIYRDTFYHAHSFYEMLQRSIPGLNSVQDFLRLGLIHFAKKQVLLPICVSRQNHVY